MSITTIDPSTDEVIQNYPLMNDAEVEQIIEEAQQAFIRSQAVDFEFKVSLLQGLAFQLNEEKQAFASQISLEMGKPLAQALAEVEKCIKLILFYADNAADYLADEVIDSEFSRSYLRYEPQGIIFAIMPWNFPLWQVLRLAIPNIIAGNAVLLSHAPNVTGMALLIDKLFANLGFEPGLFRSLIISHEQAHRVIAHPRVRGVGFTGSERAGGLVAASAGASLKKVILELGGSDPYIILDDADIEQAADLCVQSRMNNCGQVCISAKRLIVLERVYDDFRAAVLEKVKKYQFSEPNNELCNLGPMARADLRKQLQQQIQQSVAAGASCLVGGQIPQGIKGQFYPATVLENIGEQTPAYEDELFGPVISLFRATDANHAVRLANDTRFGLAAGVFSQDLVRAEGLAARIVAGNVFINKTVTSDPRFPFGGTKSSGFGRELSRAGILEFMNAKMIVAQ